MCWSDLAAANQVLRIELGDRPKLTLKSTSIWIQDRALLAAQAIDGRLILEPKKVGRTALKMGQEVFEVHISHPNTRALTRSLAEALKLTLGLNLANSAGQVTVRGQLLRWQDWQIIATAAEEHRVSYRFVAQISAELKEQVRQKMAQLQRNNGLQPAPILFGTFYEVRIPKGHIHFENYRRLLEPYGLSIAEDKEALTTKPVVKVDIIVSEIRRDLTREWGLKFDGQTTAQLLKNKILINGNILGTLTALENEGDVRILANPNILVRSGAQAEFLAGGELPIKSSSQYSSSIQWKKHGIILQVKPQADHSGRMSVQVTTEVSMIDPSVKIDNLPGFFTNRVSSHFDLMESRTIALSGMLKQWQQSGSSGLPFLSSIPVIGALFGSQDFRKNKTELVIFIKPEIMTESSPELNIDHAVKRNW